MNFPRRMYHLLRSTGCLVLITALLLPLGGCAVVQTRFQRPTEAQRTAWKDRDTIAAEIEKARLALRRGDREAYNAACLAVARGVWQERFQPIQVGDITLRSKFVGEENIRLADFRGMIATESVSVKGLPSRSVQEGWGAPFIAGMHRDAPSLANQPGIPPVGIGLPVTAVLRFDRGTPVLEMHDVLDHTQTTLAGRRRMLSGDFTALVGAVLAHSKNRAIDVRALFNTRGNIENIRLMQMEPYNPDKIPVVFVHGLLSRPEAWARAINQLWDDPVIRERYQFWFYLYPTGLPVWRSSAVLRDELNRFDEVLSRSHRTGRLRNIVVVGHSMGGLISSTLIREGGDRLWSQFSDVPPSQLKLSPEAQAELRRLVFFTPRPDVSRVIFVATPHLGSGLAVNPIAGFFANLIRLPAASLHSNELRQQILQNVREDARGVFVAPANSIRFLRARSPLLQAILRLPLSERVRIHSIIGDRGRGDSPDSSDGVVPYWSSHLPAADSEKIVPSGHGANENPEGIEEIRRILRENLDTPR